MIPFLILLLLLFALGRRRPRPRKPDLRYARLLNENAILRLRIERIRLEYERERFLTERVLVNNR